MFILNHVIAYHMINGLTRFLILIDVTWRLVCMLFGPVGICLSITENVYLTCEKVCIHLIDDVYTIFSPHQCALLIKCSEYQFCSSYQCDLLLTRGTCFLVLVDVICSSYVLSHACLWSLRTCILTILSGLYTFSS
jgi:hypothetical protein